MPNDLTPARLRELIAAATPGPWEFQIGTDSDGDPAELLMAQIGKAQYGEDEEWADVLFAYSVFGAIQISANWDLVARLVNNAPALADALEKAKLLEWLLKDMDGPSNVLRTWDGECDFIDAIRAAKEADDAE